MVRRRALGFTLGYRRTMDAVSIRDATRADRATLVAFHRALYITYRDEILDPTLTDALINANWNAMLGSVPQERIQLVHRLKERYHVLLLSNTNAIHVPAFEAIIARENGIADFKQLFHGAYYSCEIGLRKPEASSFLHVLEKHNADPTRTLFIDDSIQHVHGARKAGLHAEHLELANEDVIGLVDRLGLL